MSKNDKLDILFVISVHTHGHGGHYHSLNHISQCLAQHYKVGVISIGRCESEIIKSNPSYIDHLQLNGVNLLQFRSKLLGLLREYKPDYVNCFDWPSLSIVGCLMPSTNIKLVHTKCGGPNTHYNYVGNLVLFSNENYNWFKGDPIFSSSNIRLIPNRVKKLSIDSSLSLPKGQGFTFLAISRIGTAYTANLLKALNLIKILNENGADVNLVIIGTIENQSYYDRLRKAIDKDDLPVQLLTENRYTHEASRFIFLSDVFIGSGRGVMEATSLGKPVLSNATNVEVPVVLDVTTFDSLFENNFSPRSTVCNTDLDYNLDKIISLIRNRETYNRISQYSEYLFSANFDLDTSVDKYKEFYARAENWKYKIFSNRKYILRALYRFFKPA